MSNNHVSRDYFKWLTTFLSTLYVHRFKVLQFQHNLDHLHTVLNVYMYTFFFIHKYLLLHSYVFNQSVFKVYSILSNIWSNFFTRVNSLSHKTPCFLILVYCMYITRLLKISIQTLKQSTSSTYKHYLAIVAISSFLNFISCIAHCRLKVMSCFP